MKPTHHVAGAGLMLPPARGEKLIREVEAIAARWDLRESSK